MVIPLTAPDAWLSVPYSGIKPNELAFTPHGLTIRVDSSSSPLFHLLGGRMRVAGLTAEGTLSGLPKIPEGAEEGVGKYDDFALRIGLVVEGSHTLSFFEKLFAPGWIKRLAELAPEGHGFDHVELLALSQQKEPGTRRVHPMTKYIQEEVAAKVTAPGPFKIDHDYKEPLDAFALWVHADGDDTHSAFEVTLKSVCLKIDSPSEEPAKPSK